MALKDLIATPGEIAASRICQQFRYSGTAHETLHAAIVEAVDGAVAAEIDTDRLRREADGLDKIDAGLGMELRSAADALDRHQVALIGLLGQMQQGAYVHMIEHSPSAKEAIAKAEAVLGWEPGSSYRKNS